MSKFKVFERYSLTMNFRLEGAHTWERADFSMENNLKDAKLELWLVDFTVRRGSVESLHF